MFHTDTFTYIVIIVPYIPMLFYNICSSLSILLPAFRPIAQPGPPHYLSVLPGPTSVLFSLKTPPVSGGTPITSFVLQWRQSAAEKWKEVKVPASGRTSACHRCFAENQAMNDFKNRFILNFNLT